MLLHHSPYLPTCKTKANERAFAAEEPRHTPGIIPFSVCPIIRCPQTRCMEQLPLSSKQALRDSSGSLKEHTEEPLGSLNKVSPCALRVAYPLMRVCMHDYAQSRGQTCPSPQQS